MAWRNPYRNEQPDRLLTLTLQHPGRDLRLDRSAIDPEDPIVRMRTDDRGYILPSRRFESPDATLAFLGGSTTECAAVREALRFPALVSTLLEARGVRVDVLNAGRSGNTSHDSLNALLNHVLADGPDVVVMMHATNDIGVLRQFDSYAPDMGETLSGRLALRWLLQAGSIHSSLLGLARQVSTVRRMGQRHPRPVRLAEPDRDAFAARVRAFAALCRAFGVTPVLMTQPTSKVRTRLTPAWTDPSSQVRFNDTIRAIASEERVVLIDLARFLVERVERWDEPGYLFYDGVHVTDLGSRVFAEHIADRLLETVLAPPAEAP